MHTYLFEPGSSKRSGSISQRSSCSGGSFAASPRSQLRPTWTKLEVKQQATPTAAC